MHYLLCHYLVLDGFDQLIMQCLLYKQCVVDKSCNEIKNAREKVLGKAENRTWGCWVWSANATSVLCSPPNLLNLWPARLISAAVNLISDFGWIDPHLVSSRVSGSQVVSNDRTLSLENKNSLIEWIDAFYRTSRIIFLEGPRVRYTKAQIIVISILRLYFCERAYLIRQVLI